MRVLPEGMPHNGTSVFSAAPEPFALPNAPRTGRLITIIKPALIAITGFVLFAVAFYRGCNGD
jgi:hypothetical protein